jgi:hypothetical protein
MKVDKEDNDEGIKEDKYTEKRISEELAGDRRNQKHV